MNGLGGYAFIGGGLDNSAEGAYSFVGGGQENSASGAYSAISGGLRNDARKPYGVIGGGYRNEIAGKNCVVGGGYRNIAARPFTTIGGGAFNEAADPVNYSGFYSTIGGGSHNHAYGDSSTIAGGTWNIAVSTATGSSIGGGRSNRAEGIYSAIPGGTNNWAGGDHSFAAGRRAIATSTAPGSFVWADHTDADFTSNSPDQFLIRASGGVGIGTETPAEALDVQGNIHASGTISSGNSITVDGTANAITSSSGAISFDDENLTTTGTVTMGSFEMLTGASNDYVLTSDGSGVGTWQAAGSGGGGWVDDGTGVRLETTTDNVGIGTSTPSSKLHVDKTLSTTGSAVVQVDFGNGAGSIGTVGIRAESDVLANKGSQIAVLGATSISPVGHSQQGTAQGRLAQATGYDAYGEVVGVSGSSIPLGLSNTSGYVSFGVGGRFEANATSPLNLSGTGTYYVGGAFGRVQGEVNNASGNAVVAGIIGIDNSTGTAASFAGYFEGNAYFGGNVGIGTMSPTEELHVVGDICYTGSIGACSDKRYKKNLETLTGVLEKVTSLRGVSFGWKQDEFPEHRFSDRRQIGFIAQELEEVFPEVVTQDGEGYYLVDYGRLTPVLVEAIKDLKAENDAVKTQLAEMRAQLQQLLAERP
jgi:hypothetical protein